MRSSRYWDFFVDTDIDPSLQWARHDTEFPGVVLVPDGDAGQRVDTEVDHEVVDDVEWEYCLIGRKAAVLSCTGAHFAVEIPAVLGGCEVAFIGPRCFANQRQLREVFIPPTVEEVCDFAFMFSGIADFEAPAALRAIGNRAFFGCFQLVRANVGPCLEFIGQEAFCRTQLESLKIPGTIRLIGVNAFADSPLAHAPRGTSLRIGEGPAYYLDEAGGLYQRDERGLVLVSFLNQCDDAYSVQEGTLAVSERAFAGNPSLRSVWLPDGLRHIRGAAFVGCRALEKVRVPDSLESIGPSAFKNCGLTSFTVSAHVNDIGQDAFASKTLETYIDPLVRRLDVDAGNSCFYSLDGMLCKRGEPGDTLVFYFGRGGTVTIPDAVCRIAPAAFAGQSKVSRLVLHDHIEHIGRLGFSFANGLGVEVYRGAAPDGSDVTVRFPPCTAGVAASRSCFKGGTVDVRRALDYADKALLHEEDQAVRLLLMCRRLAEPLWLSDEHKRRYCNELDEFIGEVCAALATDNYLDGYGVLASYGLLTQDRFAFVLDAVAATGEAKAVTQLLELRHRLWGADQLDFDL